MPRVQVFLTAGGSGGEGDSYAVVRAWMARLGASELDRLANRILVDEREAGAYIKALTPRTRLVIRPLRGSVGFGNAEQITLDELTFDADQMSLGTVLHECAHAIQNRKFLDRAEIRTQKRAAGKRLVGVNDIAPHGEAFSRTYARLLWEVLGKRLVGVNDIAPHGEAFSRTCARLLREVLA